MGIFLSKNALPFFKADTESPEVEIKTSRTLGYEIIVAADPEQLEPYKHYILGTVTRAIKIFNLISYSNKYLEEYSGEFTVEQGGSVVFPSSIRWEKEPIFEWGYTYQFKIKNGIGSYIKVRS